MLAALADGAKECAGVARDAIAGERRMAHVDRHPARRRMTRVAGCRGRNVIRRLALARQSGAMAVGTGQRGLRVVEGVDRRPTLRCLEVAALTQVARCQPGVVLAGFAACGGPVMTRRATTGNRAVIDTDGRPVIRAMA